MEREIRYCTTKDDVRIAYSVEGDGPPLSPHLFEAFSLEHTFPELAEIRRRLGVEHALKGFDDAVRLYEVRWRE